MELSKMPLYKIMDEMTRLEQTSALNIYKYNLYLLELYRRFPFLKDEPALQPKQIVDMYEDKPKQKTKIK